MMSSMHKRFCLLTSQSQSSQCCKRRLVKILDSHITRVLVAPLQEICTMTQPSHPGESHLPGQQSQGPTVDPALRLFQRLKGVICFSCIISGLNADMYDM